MLSAPFLALQLADSWRSQQGALTLRTLGVRGRLHRSYGFDGLWDRRGWRLDEIERMVRVVPLDANGFRRDKMMPVLVGIRDGADIVPPVPVEPIELDQRRMYRLRDGTHRFYASLTLGFSHLPCDICNPH